MGQEGHVVPKALSQSVATLENSEKVLVMVTVQYRGKQCLCKESNQESLRRCPRSVFKLVGKT